MTGPDYVDSILDPYIKRVANFVFQSARDKLQRRPGSLHIFGLDFMIDERFRVHFIEANGYPGYTWSVNFDTRGMVTEQFNLVTELHEHPAVFEKMRAGDRYENFEMVFSELEEATTGRKYDPCYEFHANTKSYQILRAANKKFSRYTGFSALKVLESSNTYQDGCKSKSCISTLKAARKEAARLRTNAERFFLGFIDDIEGAELIGGMKLEQASALSIFLKPFGCSLNKIGVVPQTYRMFLKDECRNALKFKTPSSWIVKPFDGSRADGLRLIGDQSELGAIFESCQSLSVSGNSLKSTPETVRIGMQSPSNFQFVVQKHISNRLEVAGRTWDVRCYMLIASTSPFFVFYHEGYLRSVQTIDLTDSSELTFSQFQQLLSQEGKTGDHFMTSAFETFAKRVMLLLFHSAKPYLVRKIKSYQLLELNFLIDDAFTMYYISANRVPQLSRSTRIWKQVIQPMQDGMKSLVLETNDVPEAFVGMKYGDKHGGFRLVYSDYEFYIQNRTYDPCSEFSGKWSFGRSEMRNVAQVHDYKTRVDNANTRELKKYTKAVWDKCRSKYKSETCQASEMVRKSIAERFEIFTAKSSVTVTSVEDEALSTEQARLDQIEAFVQRRVAELTGNSSALH